MRNWNTIHVMPTISKITESKMEIKTKREKRKKCSPEPPLTQLTPELSPGPHTIFTVENPQ